MKYLLMTMLLLAAMVLPVMAEVGSRDNPVPMGTASTNLINGWEVIVLHVNTNATDQMCSSLESCHIGCQAPHGEQYVIATIQAKYIGSGSDRLMPYQSQLSDGALNVVGPSEIGYGPITYTCVPEYLPDNDVFPGGVITGNVAWLVPSSDATKLLMYLSVSGWMHTNGYTFMALY